MNNQLVDSIYPERQRLNFLVRVLAMLCLAVIFLGITFLVVTGRLSGLESSVYASLAHLQTPWMTSVMTFITGIGSPVTITALALILLLVPPTRRQYGLPIAVGSIVGAVVMYLIKQLIARGRPDVLRLVVESGYSYPSGHTLASTVVFMIILLVVFRQHKDLRTRLPVLVVCVLIPILIGISRIYLGVHYAGDVIGSFTAGLLVALFADTMFNRPKTPQPAERSEGEEQRETPG